MFTSKTSTKQTNSFLNTYQHKKKISLKNKNNIQISLRKKKNPLQKMKKWKCSTPYLKSRVALVLTLKTHNKNLHIFSRVEEKKNAKIPPQMKPKARTLVFRKFRLHTLHFRNTQATKKRSKTRQLFSIALISIISHRTLFFTFFLPIKFLTTFFRQTALHNLQQ